MPTARRAERPTPAPATPERAATAARRQAILEAARDVFLERGYGDSSIDAVIERAGGSKATVYALFGNKEGLFSAVAAACGDAFARAVNEVDVCASPVESLRRIARTYCKVVFHPNRVAMFRMAAGEGGRKPESGDAFYRLGPQRAHDSVTGFFRKCVANGLIETTDPEQLADFFLGALRGGPYQIALLNPTRIPTEAELETHIGFVVETLLRGVGRKSHS